MENVAHVEASFYLRIETDLTELEFCNKYTPQQLISSQIILVTPDGELHKVSLSDLLTIQVVEFENNKEATKQSA